MDFQKNIFFFIYFFRSFVEASLNLFYLVYMDICYVKHFYVVSYARSYSDSQSNVLLQWYPNNQPVGYRNIKNNDSLSGCLDNCRPT